jgi:hypothetical protein
VVDAATADEWKAVKCRFARLLGLGDSMQTRLADQRLEETRDKLISAAGTDTGLVRTSLEVGWAARLLDFLEENPGTEVHLQTLVREIQGVLAAEAVAAPDLAVSANGDVSAGAAPGPKPEDLRALAARSELAYSTGLTGDAAGARDQFAALVPRAERVLGPEHPDTLAARGSLAYWTGQAGDPAAARDQFAALLPVTERILGPDHPDPRGKNWPTGPGRRGTRPPRETSSPRCCPSASGSAAPSTPRPWPCGTSWPTGPR